MSKKEYDVLLEESSNDGYQKLIVKFKDEAMYYPSHVSPAAPLKVNNRRVKTVITQDEFIVVANKFIKAKIYADGRYEISPHNNKEKLKID